MPEADPALIARHAAPVPRYTSYPTAVHFTPAIGATDYEEALADLPDGTDLSLYLHIPYCHELCWYCGCNTKAVKRYDPVARYVATLSTEIESVAQRLSSRHRVTHIHWGGGSPNVLAAIHIRKLADDLASVFRIPGGAEVAVEVDPRTLSQPQVDAFVAAGVNRVSFGVQDFDPAVQSAINRIQPFDTTRRAVDMFRDAGVTSINIDLVYGLPNQTLASASRTLDRVVALAPDRVAAFGYAHLPQRLKHQRLIDSNTLPGPIERFALAERITDRLLAAGYVRIGLDHFARPGDPLAGQPVGRNFQGYTTDRSATLIGLGASAIGRLGDLYVQNATPSADYAARIDGGGLAVVRGVRLGPEDRMRAFVIERLMCDLSFPGEEIEQLFGPAAAPLRDEARALIASDKDGLVEPTRSGFRVTEKGRPFVRSLCARFDAYLRPGAGSHAAGV